MIGSYQWIPIDKKYYQNSWECIKSSKEWYSLYFIEFWIWILNYCQIMVIINFFRIWRKIYIGMCISYFFLHIQAIVLEGKYWKRRLDTVTKEYKSWRKFTKSHMAKKISSDVVGYWETWFLISLEFKSEYNFSLANKTYMEGYMHFLDMII